MKQLNEYIKEGLFDNVDKLEGNDGLDNASKGFEQLDKEKIYDYISKHYVLATRGFQKALSWSESKLKIDLKTNPPTVDCAGSLSFQSNDPTLNNDGMFQWGIVKGGFRCAYRKTLESLEGSPKEVWGSFYCHDCSSLKSLKGSPKEIVGDFDCAHCGLLESLEGATEKVDGGFYCYSCKSLKSLKGAPEKVGGDFSCAYCPQLTSLKDAPKKVLGDFNCCCCGEQFTLEDVKKVSNVKNSIFYRQW